VEYGGDQMMVLDDPSPLWHNRPDSLGFGAG